MFAVVSCNKYNRKTLRIADVGNRDKHETETVFKNFQPCECPVCGPCSHVELSWNSYFNIHEVCSELEQAKTIAKQLDAEHPGVYRLEVA